MLLTLTACASTPTRTPKDERKAQILSCIKELIREDVKALDASTICEKIYATRL